MARGNLVTAGFDLHSATIADIQSAMNAGSLTSEKLTQAHLARIAAYDKQGPAINAIITLNPRAIDEARALDAERKAGKVRGPLHGIPVVLKDNYNTFDMPTTAGSQLLEGSVPPADAFIVGKLRRAGVVIVGKANLSEFGGNGGSVSGATDPAVLRAGTVPMGFSSMGGQTRNPHDLARAPAGSSGGTGAAIAAVFAQFGLGTDTGGSVRDPCCANGIVGLKTTMGLLSRGGIVPLSLSLDSPGLMARSVTDLAMALGAMMGVDPLDPVTESSVGEADTHYTRYLETGRLYGARIGVARDFMGKDADTDEVLEAAIVTLRKLGALVIDPIRFPDYLLASLWPIFNLLVASEFKAQVTAYLQTLKPGFPRTFDDIVVRANEPEAAYRSPQKAYALKYTAALALGLDDPLYLALQTRTLPATRAGIDAIFARLALDAVLYPTSPRPPALIGQADAPKPVSATDSPAFLANASGCPDLIVPAGMTRTGLPVTISFLGPRFSEGRLLGYAYDFEQATKALRLPINTPVLSLEERA